MSSTSDGWQMKTWSTKVKDWNTKKGKNVEYRLFDCRKASKSGYGGVRATAKTTTSEAPDSRRQRDISVIVVPVVTTSSTSKTRFPFRFRATWKLSFRFFFLADRGRFFWSGVSITRYSSVWSSVAGISSASCWAIKCDWLKPLARDFRGCSGTGTTSRSSTEILLSVFRWRS